VSGDASGEPQETQPPCRLRDIEVRYRIRDRADQLHHISNGFIRQNRSCIMMGIEPVYSTSHLRKPTRSHH
jgi:hypothetical protein